jgi:hypothetical protein
MAFGVPQIGAVRDIDLRRCDLDDVDITASRRFEAVDLKSWDVVGLALLQRENPGIAAFAEVQQQRPEEHEDGLAFRVVLLQAESLASIYMDLLARVERCLAPDELISPRFVDMSCHSCLRNSGRRIDSLSDSTLALEQVAADEAGGLLELVDARLVDHAEG